MVKVTPYVSPCRKDETPVNKKLHLRVNNPHTDTAEEVAHVLSHSTTLTPADISGVLSALRSYIIDALAQGRNIQLEKIGRISLIPEFTRPVYEGDKFRNEDISTKTVQFLPDREFIKAVRFFTKYQATALHESGHVTPDEVKAFCNEWFASHEVLITTDLMRGMNLRRGKARELLLVLVEQGELARSKYGNVVQFRPAK